MYINPVCHFSCFTMIYVFLQAYDAHMHGLCDLYSKISITRSHGTMYINVHNGFCYIAEVVIFLYHAALEKALERLKLRG